ncbi:MULTISPECIES: formylmethanofuran dehydrogenase subunit A [Rhodomicrobium]|uniref:formylmethanofuran dehydrogenase subunit A n=1 Tax=Rhodomicrobium TaxID=1068 RepID=UPI000B4BD217|nr:MULTISPECIES: formylmethanofuran dehydrogenase subunit A [Rhodomicrobium]
MIRLKGGRILDPANGRDEIGDLFIEAGRIAAPPPDPEAAARSYDLAGKIVMAGGVAMHGGLAGPNANAARALMRDAAPGTVGGIGLAYAAIGMTTAIEPALIPEHAVETHLQLGDIPFIDKAALALLGNDDALLRLIGEQHGERAIDDFLGWTIGQTQALGIAAVNPGGAAAFKDNLRAFAFEDVVPGYGVSARQIVEALIGSVQRLGLPPALHLECNNPDRPGSFVTAIEAMEAAAGLPLHLAQIQRHGFGAEGAEGFSSASAFLAEALAYHKNVSVDAGPMLFGARVALSADPARQFERSAGAGKWVVWDGEGNGGGAVPDRASETDYRHAIQWAVGLELCLLIDDPWRLALTADPAALPQIIQWLMDADARAECIARLPKPAMAMCLLPKLDREFSLYEIAAVTRAAPARILGLADRGQLGIGAVADIAVYGEQADKAAMFAAPDYVFKDGELIVEAGKVKASRVGRTLRARPVAQGQIASWLAQHDEALYGRAAGSFAVPDAFAGAESCFGDVPCRT